MACMHLRNEIKTFNIKRKINYKEQYFYEKQKVSINTKDLCQCPVKSLTCQFNLVSMGINATLHF